MEERRKENYCIIENAQTTNVRRSHLILQCQSEAKYLDNVTWKSLGTLSCAYPKVERMAKFTMGLADKPVTDASSLRKTLSLRAPGLRPHHFRGNRRFFVSGGFNSRATLEKRQTKNPPTL